MTTTYKLVAFSRNVDLSLLPDGKHSGYGLVKYEDGNPVAIKTVEVTASAILGIMNFISFRMLSDFKLCVKTKSSLCQCSAKA